MKTKRTLIITSLLFSMLVLIGSCDGDSGSTPPPDPEPTKEELLVKTWEVVSVSSNEMGINHTGFTIDFGSGGNYSFNTPGIPELPQTGTWLLTNSGNIMLNGAVELEVGVLNANKFIFVHNSTSHKETNVSTQFELE